MTKPKDPKHNLITQALAAIGYTVQRGTPADRPLWLIACREAASDAA